MLTALIDGERDVHVLAEMAKARMRPKIPQPVEALTGHFSEHHAFLCRLHLERIDQLARRFGELSARIEEEMRPFARQLEQLQTIPGVGQAVAEVIIAEGKTRHGNRWLGGALGTAAMAASRTKDKTYLGARYRRLAPRLGKSSETPLSRSWWPYQPRMSAVLNCVAWGRGAVATHGLLERDVEVHAEVSG